MKSLPPHYSWLPFSASLAVSAFISLTPVQFYSLSQSAPPLLSSSLHCLLSLSLLCSYSIANMKGPLIHFANKQTLSFSLSCSLSPAPPLSVFILSPLHPGTHSHVHTRREWAQNSWTLLGWMGSFICRQIDREWSHNDLPVRQVFCCLTWWLTVPQFSSFFPPPCSYSAPCPGVWAAVYSLLTVSLCACL